jgi:hypothetical protein
MICDANLTVIQIAPNTQDWVNIYCTDLFVRITSHYLNELNELLFTNYTKLNKLPESRVLTML